MKDRTDQQRERLEAFVFVCTNERDSEYACCGDVGADETLAAIKDWLRERNAFWSPVGVSTTGCLGLCSEGGTAITIQPEDVWYSDITPEEVPDLLAEAFGPDADRIATTRSTP
ncbi:(2Fe-2S) ferredoxin domain-containing protein [Natrarchaeobaculum aegyptiacum]|uniref:Cobalamin biosynthesis protein CbiX n=1 Tax=Natrarchaeobaculum aegyptiacum TaxID=745377 RepID=A0A2Z2HU30_9EURY|nr:(2Fe-2S) ferredoxin domain-containing protein [Natrarchaeobaculum aegyptiacum]ARS88957.1 cobalamin biosynthesis protein CbiX [Natrarchaeobaculum aegyptiacum]